MPNSQKLIKLLFDSKAHLGHKSSRIHPKAKKNIYTIANGVSIIDLEITVQKLANACEFVKNLSENKKTLLFVTTKKIASAFVQSLCQSNSLAYVTHKWPAGLLTNFDTIKKNIQKLISMQKDKTEGVWQKYVKHDRLLLEKKLQKLERTYKGLINMKSLPDALFIVDIRKEKNAVSEAIRSAIPIIAVTDTNVDPDLADYPIPANDDSLSSIEYIVRQVVDAYIKTK